MKVQMKNVYRIYTEDKNRRKILATVGKIFDNFTLQPTAGYYKGRPEKSIVIEVADVSKTKIKLIAGKLLEVNRQASVLIIGLSATVERTKSNEGDEASARRRRRA